MIIEGKAMKYGNDVNTDVMLPGKYLALTNPEELGKHAMEGIDSNFLQKVKELNIIVAGRNFGCGSSREHAPIALKYGGVRCVVANSFARIFYRNAINIGLPVFECVGISERIEEGDQLIIDLTAGVVQNLTRNERYSSMPMPEFILDLVNEGLVNYMLKRRKKN